MQPDTPMPMTLTALIVLTFIPVVVYALWCDYFEKYMTAAREAGAEFNRAAELSRIRMANVFAILFQLVLYLGNGTIRKEHPYITYPLFIGALLTHAWLQSGLERKVRNIRSTARTRLLHAARAIFWSTLAGGIYLAILITSTLIFGMLATYAHVSTAVTMTAVMLGLAVGVLGGVTVCFALGPFFIRRIFSAKPIAESELHAVFRDHGISAIDLYSIDLQQFHIASAMIAGFRSGKGIMRPSLFVSQAATNSLTTSELRAVVLHEISHLKLNHLPNRLIYASGLVICSGIATALAMILGRYFLEPGTNSLGLMACLSLATSFIVAFHCLAKQSRLQEILADIHCIDKLGADLDDLANALRKMDRVNADLSYRKDLSTNLLLMGHPATEKRIKILKYYFTLKRKNTVTDETSTPSEAA